MATNPVFDGTLPRLRGLQVFLVEAGTEITCPLTGEKGTVPVNGAVINLDKLYCTKETYRTIIEKLAASAKRGA